MLTASRILGTDVGSTAPVFLTFLAIHVLGGITAVASGAIAAIARKGSPGHIQAGRWYYRAITIRPPRSHRRPRLVQPSSWKSPSPRARNARHEGDQR
jgi:hypothetical protein